MSEVVRTYHKNGNLKSEVFLLNGRKYGIFKEYHSNGELYIISSYIDDKLNGEYKSYYKNGSELSLDNSKRKNLSSTDSFGQLE